MVRHEIQSWNNSTGFSVLILGLTDRGLHTAVWNLQAAPTELTGVISHLQIHVHRFIRKLDVLLILNRVLNVALV